MTFASDLPSFNRNCPVATTRAIHQRLQALLSSLLDAGLALEVNALALTPSRVTWRHQGQGAFLADRRHATIEQYLHWLTTRAYSAVLFDGSLIQVTYDVGANQVSGHRLAYIPCPYDLDLTLLDDGFSVEDLVRLYEESPDQPVALRSHIRFDYDPGAAKTGHPAAHFTINSADCRIACVAPIHMNRFIDFIFRHFYPDQYRAHPGIFEKPEAHISAPRMAEEDRESPHLAWATAPSPSR